MCFAGLFGNFKDGALQIRRCFAVCGRETAYARCCLRSFGTFVFVTTRNHFTCLLFMIDLMTGLAV